LDVFDFEILSHANLGQAFSAKARTQNRAIISARLGRASRDILNPLFRPLRFGKLHSSCLHFAIRQKPDERFVVEIDNLDPIVPEIAKIAAESRLQS
jgi:hypothetical protein